MRATRFSHLNDYDLLCHLDQVVARDRINTAEMIALIAEVDERSLFLPAGFPTMRDYCIVKLGLSEDAAFKRIQAARAAQKFPAILDALADGRLHLAGVRLLAPHLTSENVGELIEAAERRTTAEIQLLLARRFPRSESLSLVHAVPGSPESPTDPSSPGQGEADGAGRVGESHNPLATWQVKAPIARPKVAPIGPQRFGSTSRSARPLTTSWSTPAT